MESGVIAANRCVHVAELCVHHLDGGCQRAATINSVVARLFVGSSADGCQTLLTLDYSWRQHLRGKQVRWGTTTPGVIWHGPRVALRKDLRQDALSGYRRWTGRPALSRVDPGVSSARSLLRSLPPTLRSERRGRGTPLRWVHGMHIVAADQSFHGIDAVDRDTAWGGRGKRVRRTGEVYRTIDG